MIYLESPECRRGASPHLRLDPVDADQDTRLSGPWYVSYRKLSAFFYKRRHHLSERSTSRLFDLPGFQCRRVKHLARSLLIFANTKPFGRYAETFLIPTTAISMTWLHIPSLISASQRADRGPSRCRARFSAASCALTRCRPKPSSRPRQLVRRQRLHERRRHSQFPRQILDDRPSQDFDVLERQATAPGSPDAIAQRATALECHRWPSAQ